MSLGRSSTRSLIVPVATTVAFLALGASPSTASTPRGRLHPRGTTITAVVVKSWGNCSSSSLIWDSLNANWANYGSIPISIDYSHPGLCLTTDTVTLAKLEASGADVVILSDPAGQHALYTSAEAQALSQYAQEGHDIIGTYLTFEYDGTDDRVLAPLFGVSSSGAYDVSPAPVTPTYAERYPALPLFRSLGNPYVSSGYDFSELPSDGAWSSNELTSATPVARTSDSQAVILVRKARSYYGIYIANMPEWNGSTIDEQFFYNAVIFPATG